MNDNDIIKALECCTNERVALCGECPYDHDCYIGKNTMLENARDLITHQKSEIESLEMENQSKFDKWKLLDDITKKRYAELYEEAKDVVRAEAIKEFAERLKDELFNNGYDSPDVDFDYFIDNLVKEMVGDTSSE